MGPEARPTARWSPADAQGGWQNRILARLVNEMTRYNPAWDVPYIKAPTLMVVATNDSLCPLEVRTMCRRICQLQSSPTKLP